MIHLLQTTAFEGEKAEAYKHVLLALGAQESMLPAAREKNGMFDFLSTSKKAPVKQLVSAINDGDIVLTLDVDAFLSVSPLLREEIRNIFLPTLLPSSDQLKTLKRIFKKQPVELICCSQAQLDALDDLPELASAAQIIPPPFISPDGVEHPAKKSASFIIGCVRPLAPHHGIETVIRALQLLAELLPNLQLIVVGDGEEKARLQWLVSHLHLQRRVQFVTARKEYRRFLTHFDVLIAPGEIPRFWDLDILTAWQNGIPVIATKNGVYPELIRNNENGLLFEPGNAHMLSQHLMNLYNHPDWREHYQQQAKKILQTRFAERTILEQFTEVLK